MSELLDHELANLFPLMNDAEIQNLANDIQQNGLRNPIVLFENKILDGRNRYRACLKNNIEIKTINYSGTNALNDVISWNLHRRHLNESQRAMIAVKLENMKRGGDKPTIKNIAQTTTIDDVNLHNRSQQSATENKSKIELQPKKPVEISRKQAAKQLNVSQKSVANAKVIIKKAVAEQIKDIESGKKSINKVLKEIANKENKVRLETVAKQEIVKPTGKFDVIVIDPPWPLDFAIHPGRPNQVALKYPTMTIDEIKALKVPADDNCHIFLWTTQKFLNESFDILAQWGAIYRYCFVWHKNNGFQVIGMPKSNCEFCLYGKIGDPKFIDTKAFNTCFNADQTEHSEKPQFFYDMLNRVTAGRRLDMFNRREIKGFSGYGNEVKHEVKDE